MSRPRHSSKWLPHRKSGFPCQPEHLDEAKTKTSAVQDHCHVQSRTYSDRSNFTPLTASEYDSEPSPTLRPQSILAHPCKDGHSPAVSRSDLEECRQALRKTFRDCGRAEFRVVTRLISCVLNCARWLSRREILAATTLADPDRISKRPLSANQWSQEEYWLHKCNPIILETPEGNMTFRSRSMRVFLRSFSIQGVDTSHRTLALICRNQVELDRSFARDVARLTDRPDIFRAVQIFSLYVAAFGNHHLKAASLTSMIPIAEEHQVFVEAKNSASEMNEDFEAIQEGTKQLSLSEEGDDWVLLTATPTITPSSLPSSLSSSQPSSLVHQTPMGIIPSYHRSA